MGKKVDLIEIGPRDGFQNVKEFIPTDVKLNIIDGIVRSGYKKVQVTSFVSPKAIPQMKDASEVASTAIEKYPNVNFFALVPNYYGANAAVKAGLKEITPVMSLSETHNLENVRRTREQSIEEISRIRHDFPDVKITQDIATVFGCPFEGEMAIDELLKLIVKLNDIGINAFTLCDTIGVAYPSLVEKVFTTVKNSFPNVEFNAHFHDTRNMGILNSYMAILSGVDGIQSTVGGLGGCPFAPGASGNTSSEDLVYMLEKTGFDTGIDFKILLETAKYEKEHVNGDFSGHQINITVNQCGFSRV